MPVAYVAAVSYWLQCCRKETQLDIQFRDPGIMGGLSFSGAIFWPRSCLRSRQKEPPPKKRGAARSRRQPSPRLKPQQGGHIHPYIYIYTLSSVAETTIFGWGKENHDSY